MPVKVAFIGLKGHWYGFVEELPSLPECRLVAAADDGSEVLGRLADLPGADADTQAYRDWRELLAKEQPDLVIEAGEDGRARRSCWPARSAGSTSSARSPWPRPSANSTACARPSFRPGCRPA